MSAEIFSPPRALLSFLLSFFSTLLSSVSSLGLRLVFLGLFPEFSSRELSPFLS